MKLKYQSYTPWLNDCRRIVTEESDFDDIHLVTGEEGQGKSRLMRRLALTLDPTTWRGPSGTRATSIARPAAMTGTRPLPEVKGET